MYESSMLYYALQNAINQTSLSPVQRVVLLDIFKQVCKETFKAYPFPKASVRGELCFTGGLNYCKQYYYRNVVIDFAKIQLHCKEIIIRVHYDPFARLRASMRPKKPKWPALVPTTLPSVQINKAKYYQAHQEYAYQQQLLSEQIIAFQDGINQVNYELLAQVPFSLALLRNEQVRKGIIRLRSRMSKSSQRTILLGIFFVWKRQLFQDIVQESFQPSWRCKPAREECLQLMIKECKFGQAESYLCPQLEDYIHHLVNPDADTVGIYRSLISEATLNLGELQRPIQASDVTIEKHKADRMYQYYHDTILS